MGKPNYRVLVSFDPQRTLFTARTPELEHISGEGATRKDAIARLEDEIDAQLANMLSLGTTPPRAVDETEYSGEVSAKISRGLHRDLAYLAQSEGVQLDQIVSELLSAAIALRQGGRNSRGTQRLPNGDVPEDIGNRIDSHRGERNGADGNRADGNRRPGGGGRGPNSAIMDDRANFIEYVRGLDQPGPGNGARHGGGHSNGGGPHGGGRGNDGRGGGGRGARRRGPGGGPGQNGPQQGRDGNRHGGQQHGRGPGQQGGGQHQGQAQQGGASSVPPAAPPAPSSGSGSPET